MKPTTRLSLTAQPKLSASGPRRYKARFTRAGAVRAMDDSPANLVIETDALRNNVARFDNLPVFIDHASFFENPSLTRMAGVTRNPSFNEGEESIEGEIYLNETDSGQLAARLLDDLLSSPTPPDIGLSMACYPRFAPRDNLEEPRRIIDLRKVESVDLVFQPAADGRILSAFSVYTQSPEEGESTTMPGPTSNTPNQALPAAQPRGVPAGSPLNWNAASTKAAVSTILRAADLPPASITHLSRQEWNSPEELEQAIEDERAYLAALLQDKVIHTGATPPRGAYITGQVTPLDKIELAFQALMLGKRPEGNVPPLTGIREMYHHLSGDYEMTGLFQPERIQFANVNSSTMANMVANVLNKMVINEFQQYPLWWQPIVLEMDYATLQAIRWITLGGIGELPTVAEGAAYTELSWDDSYETASFVKKGGYLGITMESIDKDDTGRLRAAPRALAQAAWLTLSKAISAIFTSESGAGPTMSDSYHLFDAGNHGNLGTSGLSVATWNTARTAMRKQTELNSGERLGAMTAPKYLLVPPDLEITGLQVLASEHDYTYTLSNGQAAPVNPNAEGNDLQARMASARGRVIVVDLWTDANDWAAVCDPRLYPTIGIGYRYGRMPEIFSVASPLAGLMFTNDTMPVKVRYVYAVGPMDYRGMYKANVS